MTFERPCRVKGTGMCDCVSHMGDAVCTQQEWSTAPIDYSPKPKVEPPSEIRQLAGMVFATYVAYTEAGFTDEQAMRLITASIMSAGKGE